jgi:AcrR family transcriptional regulator
MCHEVDNLVSQAEDPQPAGSSRRRAPSWTAVRSEHRLRQQEHIAETAMELIVERGLAGVSMSLLAERAGVSRATLYHHFPDLEHVMLAWLGLQVSRFAQTLTARVALIPYPLDRLGAIVSALTGYFAGQEHRLGIEHMGGEGLSREAARVVASQVSPITDLIAQAMVDGQRQGLIRADADPAIHAELLLGLMGAFRPHLASGRYTAETAASVITTMVVRGIGIPAAAGAAHNG